MHIGITLVSLSLGYLTYVQATKEKEGLRILGQVVGIFVILASIAGFICGVTKCVKKGMCSMPMKMNCPISGPNQPAAQ